MQILGLRVFFQRATSALGMSLRLVSLISKWRDFFAARGYEKKRRPTWKRAPDTHTAPPPPSGGWCTSIGPVVPGRWLRASTQETDTADDREKTARVLHNGLIRRLQTFRWHLIAKKCRSALLGRSSSMHWLPPQGPPASRTPAACAQAPFAPSAANLSPEDRGGRHCCYA